MDQHCIALMSEFRKNGRSLIIWAMASRAGDETEGKKIGNQLLKAPSGENWKLMIVFATEDARQTRMHSSN